MSLENPDTRSIPDGWAEHYDSERHIWYYVDLNAERPRVSFAHPCDLDRRHPSSAPAKVREHPNTTTGTTRDSLQRPAGPRKSSSASVNAIIRESQRSRRATVAQQLYASALHVAAASGSGSTSSSSRTSSTESSRRPSVSNASPDSDDVASNSAKSSTVSTTSLPSLAPHLDTHHPRKFFDCTRLAPGTRRMTINGPRPSPTPTFGLLTPDPDGQSDSASFVNAQAFYHPSVSLKTSTSPVPTDIPAKGPPEVHLGLSAKVLPKKPTITIPSNGPSMMPIKSTSGKIPERMLYNGTTEDNLIIIPKLGTRTPLRASPIPLSVSALQDDSQPMSANSSRTARNAPPPPSVTILQPKPIRPMQGISLNLQVQVSDMSEPPPNQSVSSKSGRRKSQLLKNFGLGSKAASKGKQRLIEPEESENITSGVDAFTSSMDGSFVLIDTQDRD